MVSVRGKTGNIDLAGSLGLPDGQPDEVIEVTVKPWLQPYLKTWEIETEYHNRHWISSPNSQGWWIIKAEVNEAKSNGGRDSLIKLCFPDSGDFERAPTFRIRATDLEGHIIWERTFAKPVKPEQ